MASRLVGHGKSDVEGGCFKTYFARVMSTKMLLEKFEALTPAAQRQVAAFIAALSAGAQIKSAPRKGKRFTFEWAGGLADLKNHFTAVELQHHISELR